MFIHITYEISLLISWNSIGLTYDFSTKVLETLETKSKDITVPSDGTEPSADITVPSAATEHSADITVPNTDTERSVQCFDKSLENNRSIYKILAVTVVFLSLGFGVWYCYNSGDFPPPPPGFGGGGEIFKVEFESTQKLTQSVGVPSSEKKGPHIHSTYTGYSGSEALLYNALFKKK